MFISGEKLENALPRASKLSKDFKLRYKRVDVLNKNVKRIGDVFYVSRDTRSRYSDLCMSETTWILFGLDNVLLDDFLTTCAQGE